MKQSHHLLQAISFLCLMLLQSCQSQEQRPPLDHFYGIPWGAPQENVISFLRDSLHAVVDSVDADSSCVLFKGGSTFGMPVACWNAFFVDRQLYSGGVTFHPQFIDEVMPTYRALRHTLDSLYGPPDRVDRSIDLNEKDRAILRAIRKSGDGLKVTWQFTRSGGRLKDGVVLSIMLGSDVAVSYINGDLAYIAVERNRKKARIAP